MRHKFCYANADGFGHYSHYVIIQGEELSEEQLNVLKQLLESFPQACDRGWSKKFKKIDFSSYDKKLLTIAANAYDGCKNPVLSVAAERAELEAMKQLIAFGADLNRIDKHSQLPLHWAIANALSCATKDSYKTVEVVKELLRRGAKTNIVCYDKMTVLDYARSRGYKAAAHLIENHINVKKSGFIRGATVGFFEKNLPKELCQHLSQFLTIEEGLKLAFSSKNIYASASKDEIESIKNYYQS